VSRSPDNTTETVNSPFKPPCSNVSSKRLGAATDRRFDCVGARGERKRSETAMIDRQRRLLTFGLIAAGVASGTAGRTAPAFAATVRPDAKSVLLVVDVQNCFLPGGSLAVKEGDQIIPVINRIARGFANVVLTQDWHTPRHASFASSHPGKAPFETTKLAYGTQVLWPDHCVQGTPDAELSKQLKVPQAQLVIRKGYHNDVDSYSAFLEADRKTPTGLYSYLKERNLDTIFIAGLATDFCVAWSATDAREAGLTVYVIEDACRGIDVKGSLAKAWEDMRKAGVKRIQSRDLAI
jgi:nicotinamidase/pyrazinamidase